MMGKVNKHVDSNLQNDNKYFTLFYKQVHIFSYMPEQTPLFYDVLNPQIANSHNFLFG
jgi:hypothetical protein